MLVRAAAAALRARRRRAMRTLARSGVALVVLGAPFMLLTGKAAASGATSLSGQIAALTSQVTAGAAKVYAATVAYEQDTTAAQVLSQEVATDTSALAKISADAKAARAALRNAALAGYVGELGAPQVSNSSGALGATLRTTYLSVVAGNVTQALQNFTLMESQVSAAQKVLGHDLAAANAAVGEAGAAKAAAVAQASQVDVQLAALRQDLAATVAQSAAQQAATRAAPSSTQGLPLGNGLERVVAPVVASVQTGTSAPPGTGSPVAPPSSGASSSSAGGIWAELRNCESGGNYRADTGNGFYGAYQFTQQTWSDLGFAGRPDLAAPSTQDAAAQKLEAASGWGQWPACSAALGLH